MKCDNKKSNFKTKGKAKKYLRRAEQIVKKKLYIYRCIDCGLFHFSSLDPESKIYFRNKKHDEWKKNVESAEKPWKSQTLIQTD